MSQSPPIIYTWTDEAPALATHSFLPIIRAFAGATGVPVETRDISLAGRILAVFPDRLSDDQRSALHAVAPKAKAAMQREGTALIGYQPVHGLNCFRLIFMNPTVTHDDVDVLLDLVARHSKAAWDSEAA